INGVDYLVKLAAHMRRTDPDVHFVVAGDGAKREALLDEARKLNVLERNFWVLAPLPKHQVPALLSLATVACVTFIPNPAHWPNSANKFFDALAAAKPIAINYGGWQKTLLEESGAGLGLPPNDISVSARRLRPFLADTQALERASAAAVRLAESTYSRDVHAAQLQWVLEQSTSEGRTGVRASLALGRNIPAAYMHKDAPKTASPFQ
ncbi:MAG: glycosyltransferase, partial [Rhodospirillaceae bacterium]